MENNLLKISYGWCTDINQTNESNIYKKKKTCMCSGQGNNPITLSNILHIKV